MVFEIKTKVCTKCKVEKDESDFNKKRKGHGELDSQCKACKSERNRKRREKRKVKYAGVNVYDGGERTCRKCLNVFPKKEEYWGKAPIGPDGLQSYCRVCDNRISLGYRDSGDLADDIVGRVVCKWVGERRHKRNKRENATPWIKHSEADFLDMLIQQQGRCAVSGLRLTPENVSVDHIIPVTKGGTHELSNLRLVVWDVNCAMSSLDDSRFIRLCSQVIEYQWSLIW